MPDETQNDVVDELDTDEDLGITEIDILKQKAKVIGLQHSPNIGVDTLRAKIEDHIRDNVQDDVKEPEANVAVVETPVATTSENVTRAIANLSEKEIMEMSNEDIKSYPQAQRTRLIRRQQQLNGLALVRVQIHNNDPSKNDLNGDFYSVTTKYLGTVRKYIPFGGDANEAGWHVPRILLDSLRKRKYQQVKVIKKPGGLEEVKQQLVPEFTIVELEPLTKEQLEKLGSEQKASGRV